MADDTLVTPYSSASILFPPTMPTWLNDYDAQRITAYGVYDDIYHNVPNSFRMIQRGSEANPLYVPSGKIIVNTMQRYAGAHMRWSLDPEAGTPEQQANLMLTLNSLFTRERFASIYNGNKRYGLIRGDWAFMLLGNPDKPEGSRITIKGIDPRTLFPINDPEDPDRVLGWDMIEQIIIANKTYLQRQRWVRSDHPTEYILSGAGVPGGPIQYSKDVLEVQDWEDRAKRKFLRIDVPPLAIDGITTLPIYHLRNQEEPGNPFGSSEMRGIERLIAGMNQTLTDEELSLALEGLGLYTTDAPPPEDDEGNTLPWMLGPGRVVEVPTGSKFDRLNGVGSVTPFQDHMNFMQDQMGRATGASDVAQGRVDVAMAESGIALRLRLGPILASAEERDTDISSVLDQMFYDLLNWIKVYEGQDFTVCRLLTSFGPKIPPNVKEEFGLLDNMLANRVIDAEYYRSRARELGWDIPIDMATRVEAENAANAASADPYGTRLGQEAGASFGDAGNTDPNADSTAGA